MSSEKAGYNYGEQLDAIAELLTKHHPIGQVKAIGRMECVEALRQMLEPATPPQPLQPGQEVWVRAVYVGGYIENMGDVTLPTLHSFAREDDKWLLALPLADIHPARQEIERLRAANGIMERAMSADEEMEWITEELTP